MTTLTRGVVTLGKAVVRRVLNRLDDADDPDSSEEHLKHLYDNETMDGALEILGRIAAGSELDLAEVKCMRQRLLSSVDKARNTATKSRSERSDLSLNSDEGNVGAEAAEIYDSHTAAWLMDMVHPGTAPTTPSVPNTPSSVGDAWEHSAAAQMKRNSWSGHTDGAKLSRKKLVVEVPDLSPIFCPSTSADIWSPSVLNKMPSPQVGGNGSGAQRSRLAQTSSTSLTSSSRFSVKPETDAKMHEATVNWTWDAFSFAADVEYPLATFAMYLLHKSHLIEELLLEEEPLESFLLAVDEAYAAPYVSADKERRHISDERGCSKRTLPEEKITEGGEEDCDGKPPRGAGSSRGVPYHNVVHACDVLQSTYAYMYLGGVAAALSAKQQLSLLLAAVVHDVGHPGLNNDFFIKTNAVVAHRYFGRSVLENFHASTVYTLLNMPEHKFMCHMPETDVAEVGDTITKLLLGTDMKRHFEIIRAMKHRIEEAHVIVSGKKGRKSRGRKLSTDRPRNHEPVWVSQISSPMRRTISSENSLCDAKGFVKQVQRESSTRSISPDMNDRGQCADSPRHMSIVASAKAGLSGNECADPPVASSAVIEVALSDEDQRMALMTIVLKVADLGHLARPTVTHRIWVEALQEEFWMQGDREIKLGMQPMPMLDRSAQERIGSSQVGFIEVIALPLFHTLVDAVPLAKCQLEAVQVNRDYWRQHHEPGKYRQKWVSALKGVMNPERGNSGNDQGVKEKVARFSSPAQILSPLRHSNTATCPDI